MDEIQSVLLICFITFIIEYLKIQLHLSFVNLIIFINLLGLYFIIKNVRFHITIEYN